MRILTLGAAALLLLTTVTVAEAGTAPAGVPLCVRDLYNNQQGPSSGCDGVACVGYSNEQWERCVLDCTTCLDRPAADGQAAMCVAGDVYNTGSLPCRGIVCYGQTQSAWQTCLGTAPCIPPRCHIPPPTASDGAVALCIYGDAYNTGGAPCEGGVCVGYTMGHWVDCYPRMPPCLACPPPPPVSNPSPRLVAA